MACLRLVSLRKDGELTVQNRDPKCVSHSLLNCIYLNVGDIEKLHSLECYIDPLTLVCKLKVTLGRGEG